MFMSYNPTEMLHVLMSWGEWVENKMMIIMMKVVLPLNGTFWDKPTNPCGCGAAAAAAVGVGGEEVQ